MMRGLLMLVEFMLGIVKGAALITLKICYWICHFRKPLHSSH